MGKEGPCYHCGVTSTPLWRNGPPEKPILCNACGSRWRTKGTLTNYTPLHAREPLDAEELRVAKVKSIFKSKEQKLHKRKPSNGNVEAENEMTDSDQNFRKVLEEDTSNRSSSGSAISYSESCSHFGGTDASDLTGSAQSNIWDSLVPSRKRTCISRYKPSPVEKLTKDLCSILHQQSSYFSGSSEEDLLYESETPMGSLEIGHGGVLIRHPSSAVPEEESEASSLPIDNKSSIVNEAYSGSSSLPVHIESKGRKITNVGNEKIRRAQMAEELMKRDKLSNEKFHILQNRDSSLSNVDMKDVINFESFLRHLTHEEQHQLMKYLPSIDAASPPESLRSMFHSTQFVENLAVFQQLLLEGIFDLTFSKVDLNECRTLKRLILVNLTKSKWVERYRKIKDVKCKQIIGEEEVATDLLGSCNLMPLKRPRDIQNQSFTEMKGLVRSPKRSCKLGALNLLPVKSPLLNLSKVGIKSINGTNDYIENDGSCISPRSIFASPPDRSSMLDSLQFQDSSDQALLLDVHSCSPFPEAELLCDPRKQKAVPNSLSAESGIESLSHCPSLSSSCQKPKHF